MIFIGAADLGRRACPFPLKVTIADQADLRLVRLSGTSAVLVGPLKLAGLVALGSLAASTVPDLRFLAGGAVPATSLTSCGALANFSGTWPTSLGLDSA